MSEQIRLYKVFSVSSHAMGMTSFLFETLGQNTFRKRINIIFYPMIRREDSLSAMSKYRWHSSHKKLANTCLEKLRCEALQQAKRFNMVPTSIFFYDENKAYDIRPSAYYIPLGSNQVALDSFVIKNDVLYIFQFTAGKTHDVKDGLISFLKKCQNIPAFRNWRFIFMMPQDAEALQFPLLSNEKIRDMQLLFNHISG